MTVTFESNYRQKILYMGFEVGCRLQTLRDVSQWRNQWMEELKSWHSPYKVVVDCTNLEVLSLDEKTKQAFSAMLSFFKQLHMRSIVGFGLSHDKGHRQIPFEIYASFSDAAKAIGIREQTPR